MCQKSTYKTIQDKLLGPNRKHIDNIDYLNQQILFEVLQIKYIASSHCSYKRIET